MYKDFEKRVRKDFIEALIDFSKGQISKKEANIIANRELRWTDFVDGSPVAHKGPRWLAHCIARNMGYTEYPNI